MVALVSRASVPVVLVLVAATLLAGCAAPGGADTVRLGVLVPLTGDLSPYGPSGLRAVQLAAMQFNDAGGILGGAHIEVVQADDRTSATQAAQEMSRLVNVEEVHAVIGAYGSPMTLAAWRTAADEEIPVVSPASTAPTLTDLDDDGYVFRVPPSDALQGEVMAQLLLDDGVVSIAIMGLNQDYGRGFGEILKEQFTDGGGAVVAEAYYDPKGTQFFTELDTVAAASPEAVVLIAYPDTGTIVMRNAFERGHTDDFAWYFSEGVYTQTFVDDVGEDEEGNVILAGFKGTTPQPAASAPSSRDFNDAYEDEYGEEPALFAAEAYDAAVLLLLAMEAAGTTDGEAVRDALTEVSGPRGEEVSDPLEALEHLQHGDDIDYSGASGAVDWDENGDPAAGIYAIWQVTDEGELETLDEGIIVE